MIFRQHLRYLSRVQKLKIKMATDGDDIGIQRVKVKGEKPEPRSGHRCCATSDCVYAFGGYNREGNRLFNELWCYNISTKRWQEVPNSRCAPFESASSSVVLSGDKIFVFGGCGYPFGETNSNKLLVYSLSLGDWFELLDVNYIGNGPSAKYGQSMVLAKDGKLYVFSGTIGREFVDEFHCFDLENLKWEKINSTGPCPEPRYRHEVVCTDDRFYVFGGAITGQSFGFQEIHSYEFESKTWFRHQCKFSGNDGYPPPRKCHSCVLYDRTVYMCGGMLDRPSPDQSTAFDDFWKLSLDDLVWTKVGMVSRYPCGVIICQLIVNSYGCHYQLSSTYLYIRQSPLSPL